MFRANPCVTLSGTVPWSVIQARDICGFGRPTAEKKSAAPKSSRLILARCMALVPSLGPRVLTSKFSIKETPAKRDWQHSGTGRDVLGLLDDAMYTANQAMLANRHAQAVDPPLHLGIGLVIQQKAGYGLPTFTQPGQGCFSTSSHSLGQAFNLGDFSATLWTSIRPFFRWRSFPRFFCQLLLWLGSRGSIAQYFRQRLLHLVQLVVQGAGWDTSPGWLKRINVVKTNGNTRRRNDIVLFIGPPPCGSI